MNFKVPSKCSGCGKKFDVLWPVGDGLCDECLSGKIREGELSLKEVKKKVCRCLHRRLIEIITRL